jgi:hypothetical protein
LAIFKSLFRGALRSWAGLVLVCGLAGCGADERCLLLNSDFEQFDGWVTPAPPFLSTEKAHSGR